MIELASALKEASRDIPQTTVMEVCGTHTQAVARYALKQLLPDNMKLISGPGCPVCVTGGTDIAKALAIAKTRNTVLYSFADMLRVPAFGGTSLWSMRGAGAAIRMAASPLDALDAAIKEPDKQVVFFAVGFETTAPLTAAMLTRAKQAGVKNLSVLAAHKTMPAALKGLLKGNTRVHALLCPGHVAVITGADAFAFVPEKLALPAAISGFEPREILSALTAIAAMRARGEARLINCYKSAVTAKGNAVAQRLMQEVFTPCTATWRGLGEIEHSGLALSEGYTIFDATKRFELSAVSSPPPEPKGCICAQILRGEAEPRDCGLFQKRCKPDTPEGPCMVSGEGACAAAYRY